MKILITPPLLKKLNLSLAIFTLITLLLFISDMHTQTCEGPLGTHATMHHETQLPHYWMCYFHDYSSVTPEGFQHLTNSTRNFN